jgi:hypothetical protein
MVKVDFRNNDYSCNGKAFYIAKHNLLYYKRRVSLTSVGVRQISSAAILLS